MTGECLWLTDVRALATSHEVRLPNKKDYRLSALCLDLVDLLPPVATGFSNDRKKRTIFDRLSPNKSRRPDSF